MKAKIKEFLREWLYTIPIVITLVIIVYAGANANTTLDMTLSSVVISLGYVCIRDLFNGGNKNEKE